MKGVARLGDYSPCLVDACNRVAVQRGYCRRHYMRHWRYGTTEDATPEDCAVCGFDVHALSLCKAHFLTYHRILKGSYCRPDAQAIVEAAQTHKARRQHRATIRRDAA
jgi:hypothetical protein